jgi:hypothetical protein
MGSSVDLNSKGASLAASKRYASVVISSFIRAIVKETQVGAKTSLESGEQLRIKALAYFPMLSALEAIVSNL